MAVADGAAQWALRGKHPAKLMSPRHYGFGTHRQSTDQRLNHLYDLGDKLPANGVVSWVLAKVLFTSGINK